MHDAILFLASLLHISTEDLEKALTATYERKAIPKRTGGVRRLSVPSPPLRFVQRRILTCLLCQFELSGHLYGFQSGRSTVMNAQAHRNIWPTHYCLKVDLKDAFTNVKEAHFRTFIGALLGAMPLFRAWRAKRMRHWYDPKENTSGVRFPDINRFFTKLAKGNVIFKKHYRAWLRGEESWRQLSLFDEDPWVGSPSVGFEEFLRDTFELLLALTFHNGSLPQGAPSSPYLLNLSLRFSGLVRELERIMIAVGPWVCSDNWDIYGTSSYHFSIYADDMTFSLPYSFNDRPLAVQGDQRSVKGMILSAIEASGLYTVNTEKVRSFNSHKGYPLITGLRVEREKVGLPKKKVTWLRSFVHHARQSTDPRAKEQLKGWASYVRMVYEVKSGDDSPKVPSQIREILNY